MESVQQMFSMCSKCPWTRSGSSRYWCVSDCAYGVCKSGQKSDLSGHAKQVSLIGSFENTFTDVFWQSRQDKDISLLHVVVCRLVPSFWISPSPSRAGRWQSVWLTDWTLAGIGAFQTVAWDDQKNKEALLRVNLRWNLHFTAHGTKDWPRFFCLNCKSISAQPLWFQSACVEWKKNIPIDEEDLRPNFLIVRFAVCITALVKCMLNLYIVVKSMLEL